MENDQVKDFIREAYEKTAERIRAIDGVPANKAFKNLVIYTDDHRALFAAYYDYFYGYFDGIIFTRFLDTYDAAPTEQENKEIIDLMEPDWEKLNKLIVKVAAKNDEMEREQARRNNPR